MQEKNNDTKIKNKSEKVQIWVKQETLAYEKELTRLQVELLNN